MSDTSLRDQAPLSLRRMKSLNEPFQAATNYTKVQADPPTEPCISDAFEKPQGSQMVKRHKPQPELKPTYSNLVKKSEFNSAWIQEQRAAKLDEYRTQKQGCESRKSQPEPVWRR